MMSYKVYCIVNKKFTDQEYSDFINSQDIVANQDILFVTKAKITDKVLIGVKQDKFCNIDRQYICVQRKYYKACIKNTYKDDEIDKIKEYVEKTYENSYFAVDKEYIYFNIKHQNVFRELVDKQNEEITYQDIKFSIITLFNKDHPKQYHRRKTYRPRRRYYRTAKDTKKN